MHRHLEAHLFFIRSGFTALRSPSASAGPFLSGRHWFPAVLILEIFLSKFLKSRLRSLGSSSLFWGDLQRAAAEELACALWCVSYVGDLLPCMCNLCVGAWRCESSPAPYRTEMRCESQRLLINTLHGSQHQSHERVTPDLLGLHQDLSCSHTLTRCHCGSFMMCMSFQHILSSCAPRLIIQRHSLLTLTHYNSLKSFSLDFQTHLCCFETELDISP